MPRAEVPAFRRHPDLLWRRTHDRILLLAPGDPDAEVVVLTGSGVALWDELAESSSLEALAARLGELFGAEPELVAADVAPVLEGLERRGLLLSSGRSQGASP